MGEPKGAATAAPAKAASSGNVTAFAGSAARKLEAATAISTSEIVAFKRDYEERAAELAEEIVEELKIESVRRHLDTFLLDRFQKGLKLR